MRFYNITITDPNSGQVVSQYSSLDSFGNFIPGALNIEFDIPVVGIGNPGSGAYVRIWGVSLRDIGQSNDLNNKLISVYAGMSKGLPLANPAQQGLLISGFIFQAYGNWIGTQQSLDLVIMPGMGVPDNGENFAFNYKAGTLLSTALSNTLSAVYPTLTIDTSGISSDLVIAQDQQGHYSSLSEFASYILGLSLAIKPATASGGTYSGVNFVFSGNTIKAIDNSASTQANPIEIKFTDLVGQPTWNSVLTFQFNCVLRGDLQVGDYIKMPVTQFTSIPSSLARFRQNSVFQGLGQILGSESCIRHVGNFRQPNGESWITTVNCVVVQ